MCTVELGVIDELGRQARVLLYGAAVWAVFACYHVLK